MAYSFSFINKIRLNRVPQVYFNNLYYRIQNGSMRKDRLILTYNRKRFMHFSFLIHNLVWLQKEATGALRSC